MSELVEKLDKLLGRSDEDHWFCPRSGPDDDALYYDEDTDTLSDDSLEKEKEVRKKKLEEARSRQLDALSACKILAFDGDDARQYQEKLKRCLQVQLGRCDVCVREYHRGRRQLQALLESEYDEEQVQPFMEIFDQMNISRIVAGLNHMSEALEKLPPAKRNISATGDTGMYALFEALNCIPFLQNEEVMRDAFDTPFRLVQTNRKLKLGSYVPAMTSFLFSNVAERNEWAVRSFKQAKHPPRDSEVKFAIQPLFETSLKRVTMAALDFPFLPRFWNAVRMIITKLEEPQLNECLRGTDLDILPISLDHLHLESTYFTDLVECYRIWLGKSPRGFWDAMGAAAPQVVIEQICKSPMLESMLRTTEEKEPLQLEDKLAWADTFIQSINPNNIVPPLQTLLGQMLHRFQQNQYSRYARRVTYVKGLQCLLESVKLVKKSIAGGPVCTKLIESVSKEHASILLQELDGIEKKEEFAIDDVEQLVLDIVENVLALDIQALSHDRRIVVNKPDSNYQVEVSSLEFWKMTLRHIKVGQPALVIAVLSGVSGLLALEKLSPAQIKRAPKQAESWNKALGRVLEEVNGLLEKLESFNLDSLDGLFNEREGIQGVIILLLNEDVRLQQSALGLLKTLSRQDERRGCIMEVAKRRMPTLLGSFAAAFDTISRHRCFGPCLSVLKFGADIFSTLCDSQDGILRSRRLSEKDESQALNELWRTTWSALEMIFETTEAWSELGHDKTQLQDFCRETMDFAESAFGQYSIFAEALRGSSPEGTSSVAKQLLDQPNRAFHSIAKWLRLRDEYLIIKAVSLTVKMLNRLRAASIKVSPVDAQYLQGILATGKSRIRTNLSMNQKAEIQRALESHIDEPSPEVADSSTTVPKKQGSLQSWVTSGRDSRSTTPMSGTDSGPKAALQSAKSHTATNNRLPAKSHVSAATQIAAQKRKEEAAAFLAKRKQDKAEQERAKQARAKAANLGAGSGTVGLGDFGKEHSVKGQNVMVSSDESDDEDSDIDDDLFGTGGKQRKKIERPNVNLPGAIGLKIEQKQGPTRIHRAQRSMKDMRARLAPDLTPLHRTILNWDYFHNGDYPPNADASLFSKVENSFRDPISYQNTFEPLLTLEAWQGMVKSREEIDANNLKPYEIKVQNRSTVDSFVEISSLLDQAETKRLGLQEGDIILFSKGRKPADEPTQPHCLARIYRIKRQKGNVEVVYQVPPASSLTSQMTIQTMVYGLKIQSITPLEREYGALKALQYYDLCPQIVRAKPSQRLNISEKQVAMFQDIWNVNKAQSEAINAALENDGFSLIQGPPGSGKTKTIVAIVGGLLTKTLESANLGSTKISMPRASTNITGGDDGPSRKLLVCAPSNAAVDELVMRLKDGVKTRSGRRHDINVVRIGRSEAINSQVKDVTMEELVSRRLGNAESDPKKRQAQADLFGHHKQISTQLQESLRQRDTGDLKGNDLTRLESTITQLRKQKNELGIKIDNFKDQERNAGRQAELDRKRAQQAVLDGAHVICATLSGSGHDMFQGLNIEFETVIIDEAAQCVEMSSLIPLKYGCVKCIMVGDPKQLPPTVFSKEAAKFQYEQSLFVRMQNNNPGEVHLLDTQYRMHPHISLFPSRTFYDGLLKDGLGMAGLRKQPWHQSSLLAPYRFYDVKGQQQTAPRGRSFINVAEIDVAMSLYHRLTSDFPDYDFNGKIGIITPYKAQLSALKDRFSSRFGSSICETIEFNTTDAFQGRESEIIIFSCVRASDGGGIGFLQDIRRMNVGLTRARSSLWVLGNSGSLAQGKYWKQLIDDAQARQCYTTGNLTSMLAKHSKSFPANDVDVPSTGSAPQRQEPDVSAGSAGKIKNEREVHKSNGEATSSTVKQDPDRMEGIRYRFGDRVAKVAKDAQPSVKSEHPDSEVAACLEDVEMAEADDPEVPSSELRTGDSATSVSYDQLEQPRFTKDMTHGSGQPKATSSLSSGQPAQPRKRHAPSPFLPRKKPKPPTR